jgi:exodeoxyribonuclease VII small subunit
MSDKSDHEQLQLKLNDESPPEPRKSQSANHSQNQTQVITAAPRQPKKSSPSDGAKPMPETTATTTTTTSATATKSAKSADFETMLAELEKVVGQLEGELKLEEALALFERGLGLSQDCEKFLKAAQQKIEILKRTASGVQTEAFEEDGDAAN